MSKGDRLGLDMKIARMGHTSRNVNLLSEWCSSGADMKKAWMDSTLTYIPFRLLIEASLMRRYHNKYNLWSKVVRCGDKRKNLGWDILDVFPIRGSKFGAADCGFSPQISSSLHHNSG